MKINKIVIPLKILQNKNLTISEKVVIGIIITICNKEKIFLYTNEQIGKIIGLTPDRISKIITKLNRLSLIKIVKFDGRSRYLTITDEGV
jgi:DNA-binding MarR family transcriptional regulator